MLLDDSNDIVSVSDELFPLLEAACQCQTRCGDGGRPLTYEGGGRLTGSHLSRLKPKTLDFDELFDTDQHIHLSSATVDFN